jgi:hypothetical protein
VWRGDRIDTSAEYFDGFESIGESLEYDKCRGADFCGADLGGGFGRPSAERIEFCEELEKFTDETERILSSSISDIANANRPAVKC